MFRYLIKKILFGILIGFVVFLPAVSVLAAAEDELPGVTNFNIEKVSDMITGFACWTIQIISAIMVIALVASGVRFFLAHGDPAKVGAAKKNFTWVLVGIAVVLATNIIIATVGYVVGGEDFHYNPLDCGSVTRDINLA